MAGEGAVAIPSKELDGLGPVRHRALWASTPMTVMPVSPSSMRVTRTGLRTHLSWGEATLLTSHAGRSDMSGELAELITATPASDSRR